MAVVTLPQRDSVDRDIHRDEVLHFNQPPFNIGIFTWEVAKGNILDCGRDDSKGNNLKPGVSDRNSLEQSNKYPSSHRDSLDDRIPDVQCQETDPIDQTEISINGLQHPEAV